MALSCPGRHRWFFVQSEIILDLWVGFRIYFDQLGGRQHSGLSAVGPVARYIIAPTRRRPGSHRGSSVRWAWRRWEIGTVNRRFQSGLCAGTGQSSGLRRTLRKVTIAIHGEESWFGEPPSRAPSEPLAQPIHQRIREVTAHKREGINPSPKTNTVGAGFIPARAIRSFAGGSLSPHLQRSRRCGER